MNYTKGELRVDRGNSFQAIVYPANKPSQQIASIPTGISIYSGCSEEEGTGNLNLFLASGDMYEALKAIMGERFTREEPSPKTCLMAENALSKAEGK